MPTVNWCKTKAGKREIAALELMRHIEAARAYAGLTLVQLEEASGIKKTTYLRRKASPQDLQIGEIQALSTTLHLGNFPGVTEALLQLLT